MRRILARPDRILTLKDYPVHNDQILRIYFKVFNEGHGNAVPPCPVIRKEVMMGFIKANPQVPRAFGARLGGFLEANPNVELCLISNSCSTRGRSHRQFP